MKKKVIIIGGTGQYGITLSEILIRKKFKLFVTSRYQKKINYFKKKYHKIEFIKLNIYNKKKIENLLKEINPSIIFYFAGQSSPKKSFIRKNYQIPPFSDDPISF